MASLFTAPRSRRVMYDSSPIATMEIEKSEAHQEQVRKYSGVRKKLDRVVSEQIPVLRQLNGIRAALGDNNKFIFPGVQTIRWSMARDITEQYGLQSYTILPWYTKAVAITITGKAYLGAFATDLTASGGLINTSLQSKGVIEYIRDEMRGMDSRLSGYNITSGSSSAANNLSLVSALSVGTDGEAGSIKVIGFVKSFEVDENVTSPYVQTYTLQYLGVDMAWYNESRARNCKSKDTQQLSSPIGDIKHPPLK